MPKCKKCINLYNLSDITDSIVVKWCPKINVSPDLDMNRECKHYKAMTNADRIRRMTDEELVEFLCNITTGDAGCDDCLAFNDCRLGHTGFEDWLKAESEG